jgi:heme exporter protein C
MRDDKLTNVQSQPNPARWARFALPITLIVMAYAFYLAMTAPVEATMGNLYRVFFYHVPHAMLSFVFPYINTIASLAFLYWRARAPEKARKADALALAAAEITVLYATVGLATGMLWGRAAWGIWWAWDARLTTYLLLWLLYVSYLLVRRMSAGSLGSTTGVIPAVLGLFAAVDIPICFESIRWWRTQHPSAVFGGDPDSGLDPSMYPAFLWNVAGWLLWGTCILALRYALERRRQLAAERAAMDLLGHVGAEAYNPNPSGLAGQGGLA